MLLLNAKQLVEGISMIKRNRANKIASFAGRSAITICQHENPSLYRMYKKYKDLHMEFKKKIDDKYGKRAESASKRTIR